MARLRTYGIRHHGPGSAKAVLRALERDPPEVLAVEMPADFTEVLGHVADPALRAPVSLVAYAPVDVQQALYYPLAGFSPEWVAMRWAAGRGIPIVPVDLPTKLMIALNQKSRPRHKLRVDPLGELAKLAGYADRERWWEKTFELTDHDAGIFPAVTAMITTLREAYPEATDAECTLREMHMAREIARVIRGGAASVAFVCGAWHAAALPDGEGKGLLSRLRKTGAGYASAKTGIAPVKLDQAWIPWTYERLRSGGGYGAGVVSPVWYDLLYRDPATATEAYLTMIAREMRDAGAAASTAQIVDAVELASSLKVLRGLALEGLDEIQEAARSTLAQGSETMLERAMRSVESFRTSGSVPVGMSSLPLQQDLEARLKEVRLLKVYRDMEPAEKSLDLRKAAHLAASQLICQLLLLDIPFGDRVVDRGGALGTFKESWRLHWAPDFAVLLISAHRHGHTVEEAARNALYERLAEADDLMELVRSVDLIVLAGLHDDLSTLAAVIKDRAAATVDAWMLARALPSLLRLARYHSLRLADAAVLEGVNAVLLPKLAVGLVGASEDIDEEAASLGFDLLKTLQPYVGMLEDETLRSLWERALRELAAAPRAHPLLKGFAHRTLVDAESLDAVRSRHLLGMALGAGVPIDATGHYVEGFLYSSAQVLIHQPEILMAITVWLEGINLGDFRSLLPVLRRTMGRFTKSERRKLSATLGVLLKSPTAAATSTADAAAAATVQPGASEQTVPAQASPETAQAQAAEDWADWISSWLAEPLATRD